MSRGAAAPRRAAPAGKGLRDGASGRSRAESIGRIAGSRTALVALFVVPFTVAAVRLASRHWMPVLDMAMTEIRVRDVGTSRTPLIGLPGRIGHFPDQGSHAGPLSFYLLAPLYRLFGSSGGALLVSACVVAAGCCVGTVATARRLGGPLVQWAVAAALLITIAGLGLGVVTQPWNPYLPLLFWCLALVAAWAVLAGHHRSLVVLIGAASVCAQTHISYLTQAIGLSVLGAGAVVWQSRRSTDAVVRRAALRSLAIAGAVGVVLWSPVFIEQVTRPRGNLGYLRRHFSAPSEGTIGLRSAASLMLRHLDITHFLISSESGKITDAADWPSGSPALGLLLLVVWATSAVLAVRARHRRLIALDAVIAAAGLTGWFSASRIFGMIWFYLTLWGFVLGPLMVLAIAWTGWSSLGPRMGEMGPDRARTAAYGAVAAIAVLTSGLLTVQAARMEPPEQHLSRSLRAVVAPTVRALKSGRGPATGPRGRYVVLWNDAYLFGSPGYGLVNELELQGIDVGSPRTWHVPLTRYRVREVRDATAVVKLTTGAYIAQERAVNGAVQVAYADTRTPAEVAEFDRLRTELVADLGRLRLTELLPLVERNLFGVALDPRLPSEQRHLVNRMLEIGEPFAVFLEDPRAVLAAG